MWQILGLMSMVLLTKAGPYTNNEQKQNKMFSLFNKNKIDEQDFYFLKNVICILPTKWDFLIKQINSRFIIGKCKNKHYGKGFYSLILNREYHDYSDYNYPELVTLSGILIWNKKRQEYVEVQLDISFGTIIGYYFNSKYSSLDWHKVSLNTLKENNYANHSNGKKDIIQMLSQKLSPEELKKIDIGDINELQIEGNTYYTIKNLNDGDYMAINNTGEVFIITHAPFEVKKLYSSIRAFLHQTL